MLEEFANVLTILAEFKTLIGVGATSFSLIAGTGFAPRVGPMRAFVLALRSKFRASANPFTNRDSELKRLRSLMGVTVNLCKVVSRQQYVVVFGHNGFGKSCLVNSATSRTCGVVRIEVDSSEKADGIVDGVYPISTFLS